MGIDPWAEYFFVLSILPGQFGCLGEDVIREHDHIFVVFLTLVVVWSSQESICPSVLSPFKVVNLDVIIGKFYYFPCYSTAYLLGVSPVLQIHVVGEYFDLVG